MIRIYIRVSSEKQTKGLGADSQEMQLKSFCAARYPESDIKVYNEQAISGTMPLEDRPKMSELLNDLQEGDVILAREVSRLSRVVWHGAKFLKDAIEKKVVVSCFNAMEATETSYGAMIFHIMLAIAENERMTTRERTELGVKAAKKKGQFTGGTLYFWEELDSNKQIIDNEEGLQRLRLFADLYKRKTKQVEMCKIMDVAKGTMSRWCKDMKDTESRMFLRVEKLNNES